MYRVYVSGSSRVHKDNVRGLRNNWIFSGQRRNSWWDSAHGERADWYDNDVCIFLFSRVSVNFRNTRLPVETFFTVWCTETIDIFLIILTPRVVFLIPGGKFPIPPPSKQLRLEHRFKNWTKIREKSSTNGIYCIVTM